MSKLNFDLDSYFVSKREQVNAALKKILQDSNHSKRIITAMIYSLMAGGKRLRPILCLAATEAVGGKIEDTITVACTLEMIHTYSLIHDDLPAMDNDDLRRGKPTCHIAFDEATAILAGDALLTLAFQILSSFEPEKYNNAPKWLEVIHSIALAAGYKGMIGGQMVDIMSEGTFVNLDDLKNMYHLKTGAMINASVCSGAILGGASPEQLEQLEQYSNNIGLAFQVTDDILNVEGNPSVMGKAVGTDNARNKSTYPSILGIEASKAFSKELVNTALQAIENFDNRCDPLRAIAYYIVERKR